MLVQQGPGNLILTGTNTQTQGTLFSGGTVTVASDANLGAGGHRLTFYGGTLAASAPLDLVGGQHLAERADRRTINTNGFNVTMPGQIYPGSGPAIWSRMAPAR